MDTRENVITWFTREFGFSCNAATALHDVQVLKDAQALSELDDDVAVANVCKAVGKDVSQSIAKIAATKLKLVCLASQTRGNTTRNTQTSRMDARRGAPSTIISLGGTR